MRPHRSATLSGIRKVVIGVAAVLFIAGVGFALAGAWPVFGFLGLEVLLLYAALNYNHRRGREEESLDLTHRSLTVRRIDYWGGRRRWSFQPQWLQVSLDQGPGPTASPGRLEIRSHGQSLAIGAFLTANEKSDLANDLRAALRDLTGGKGFQPNPNTSRME